MASQCDSIDIRPPVREEYEQIVQTTAPIFRANNPQEWIDRCNNGYIAGSSYDWQASRIATINGKIVAHVGVWRLNVSIGSAKLLCGGIGAVGTTPECRGHGIASGLMKAVMQSMADGGYVISSMYGRSNFYGRYGYMPVFSRSYAVADGFVDEKGKLDANIEKFLELKCSTRPASMESLLKGEGDLGKIYESGRKFLSFTADRPVYTLNCNLGVELVELVDPAGQLKGYIAYSVEDEQVTVSEVGGFEAPDARRELLGQMYKLAMDCGKNKLRLNIPRTHPMMTLLKRYDCGYYEYFHTDGNAMVAIVNLPAALNCMKDELQQRLAASSLSGGSFAVNLAVGGQKASISAHGGQISVSSDTIEAAPLVQGDDLPRLLLGSEPAPEVIEAGEMDCDSQTLEKLEILFPPTDPRLPDGEYH